MHSASPLSRTLNTENLAPKDGELYLIKQFYAPDEAEQLHAQLMQELAWQTEQLFIYGRWLTVPRLMCWYGDPGATYQYSKVPHSPLPWTTSLLNIKQHLEHTLALQFNSVLANLYRNGQDSMGCHADNEPELGPNPTIASLSLGDSRILKFKHQDKNTALTLNLEAGDLLLMAGSLQQHWRHELPKTRRVKGARINLTFRRVLVGC